MLSVVKPKYTLIVCPKYEEWFKEQLERLKINDVTLVVAKPLAVKDSFLVQKHDLDTDLDRKEREIFHDLYLKFKEGKEGKHGSKIQHNNSRP